MAIGELGEIPDFRPSLEVVSVTLKEPLHGQGVVINYQNFRAFAQNFNIWFGHSRGSPPHTKDSQRVPASALLLQEVECRSIPAGKTARSLNHVASSGESGGCAATRPRTSVPWSERSSE